MSDELTLLKERADQLGISYKANIGTEALKAKVTAVMQGASAKDVHDDDSLSVKSNLSEADQINIERQKQHDEQMALVRIKITCLNPLKAELPGELVSIGNSYLGSVRKFVPFGESTDGGYHVPRIIFEHLKSRQYNAVKTKKLPNGGTEVLQRVLPEFAIEVLPQLTPTELETLARVQAAAAGQ